MKEDDSNWFSKWEEQLPKPEELMPLNQTLITPDLAIAFDIGTSHTPHGGGGLHHGGHHHRPLQHPSPISTPSSQPNSGEFDSSELGGGGGGGGGDEPARTLKRPRLVWTPQLHKRFVDAVAHLGIKNAVPKTIMQLMSVDGLTRENVASHLQKYRLYLKRMQGLSSGGGGGGGGFGSGGDPATDRLFASSPVPPHFLHQTDNFLPYMPAAALQQQHHHQQMAAAVAVAGHHHLRRHFGSTNQSNHQFLSRQSLQPVHRVGTPVHNSVSSSYVDDLESAQEKKALTLFPIGDD